MAQNPFRFLLSPVLSSFHHFQCFAAGICLAESVLLVRFNNTDHGLRAGHQAPVDTVEGGVTALILPEPYKVDTISLPFTDDRQHTGENE